MDMIPIDIISNEIIMFLDERSLVLFSMTNKKNMICFKKSKWLPEICIKLIIYVINNDELIEKIKNILIEINFKCDKYDFWSPKLYDILKKNNRLELLSLLEKIGCPNYFFQNNYNYHHRHYDYDDINNDYPDDYDFWLDQNDNIEQKNNKNDDDNYILYIKECKKKNRQINYDDIYEIETYYYNDLDQEIYDDDFTTYDDAHINCINNENIKYIGKSTLGDYFPISLYKYIL